MREGVLLSQERLGKSEIRNKFGMKKLECSKPFFLTFGNFEGFGNSKLFRVSNFEFRASVCGLRRDRGEHAPPRNGPAEFAEETDRAGPANTMADFRCAGTHDVAAPGADQRGQEMPGSLCCLHVCGSLDDRVSAMFKKSAGAAPCGRPGTSGQGTKKPPLEWRLSV